MNLDFEAYFNGTGGNQFKIGAVYMINAEGDPQDYPIGGNFGQRDCNTDDAVMLCFDFEGSLGSLSLSMFTQGPPLVNVSCPSR